MVVDGRDAPPRTATRRGLRSDLVAVGCAVALVVAAALVGRELNRAGVPLVLGFPPVLAEWMPHVGPGTPVAVVTAVAVIAWGPGLAQRMRWRPLLVAAWATASVWTMSLALVDGWTDGVVARLTSDQEYLWDVSRVPDVPAMLRTFTDFVLTDQPVHWVTHVGAHPPGVLLLFVWLDRVGLGGGGAAGLAVVLVGASACAAVAVTLRALGAEAVARAALPFGVLLPGAVWMGVSADGMFAGILAWGVALLAVASASRGRRADVAAVTGGILLGYCLYLSYGLVLGGLLPLAVVAVRPRLRPVLFGLAGAAAVVVAFTASGFWWFTGYEHVKVIYAASAAQGRPYSYFVWADIAALLVALGPATVAGIRRLAVRSAPSTRLVPAVLVGAALVAVVVADVSGLSKAEVERIWLPFGVWLVLACAYLPARQVRGWLAAQAVLALAVNHLLLTVW